MTHPSDIYGVLAAALVGGPTVALIVWFAATDVQRRQFCSWGLVFGLVTVVFFGLQYLLGTDPVGAKGLLTLMFVGGPVGIAALLLSAVERIRNRAKS